MWYCVRWTCVLVLAAIASLVSQATRANAAADMKAISDLPASVTAGASVYSSIRCANFGSDTTVGAFCNVSGLPPGLTAGCYYSWFTAIPPGYGQRCDIYGTPSEAGSFEVTVTTGAENDGDNSNNVLRVTLEVLAAEAPAPDMTVNTFQVPNFGTVGTEYSGTFFCTASGESGSATMPTCSVSGLPAGLSYSCEPASPESLEAGGAINCVITGTPSSAGEYSVSFATGSGNDSDTENNSAVTTIAVTGGGGGGGNAGSETCQGLNTRVDTFSGNRTINISGFDVGDTVSVTTEITGGIEVQAYFQNPFALLSQNSFSSTSPSVAVTSSAQTLVVRTQSGEGDFRITYTCEGSAVTASPDMQLLTSKVPTTAAVGKAYVASFACPAVGDAGSASGPTCRVTGLPTGLDYTCDPGQPETLTAGDSIVCSISGTPTESGEFRVTFGTGAENDSNTENNTASVTLTVSGGGGGAAPDMIVNTFQVPNFGAVGTEYSGTFFCTASGDSGSASGPTCRVTGLPSGLDYTCLPESPDSLAAGDSIMCSITGTPDKPGTVVATFTTGAENDSDTNNNTVEMEIDIESGEGSGAPDMVAVTKFLSQRAAVGQPYSGNVVCINAGTATAFGFCAAKGLPPGLSLGECQVTGGRDRSALRPVEGSYPVDPEASITCPVEGTPTTAGSFEVSIGTGAEGDRDGSNDSATVVIQVEGGGGPPQPSFTASGSVSPTAFSQLGQTLTFTVVLVNTGQVAATGITVSDARLGSLVCGATSAAPGATVTCTGTTTTTAADLTAGTISINPQVSYSYEGSNS